jgi:hypothetical protein
MRKRQSFINGQGFIEYILIIVLVGLSVIMALRLTGVSVSDLYQRIVAGFGEDSKTILSENFHNLNNWKQIFGADKWAIKDGWLVSSKGGDKRIMMISDLPNDYVITTTAQLLDGKGFGIMFRLTPDGNNYGGYSFQLDPGYGNKLVLRKFVQNGVEVSKPIAVANPPAGFDFYAEHEVKVSVIGNTFTAYIDGVKVMTAIDDTYPSGGAGLRSWSASNMKADDFTISEP